jgi:Zn-dependent peptidase ImmA (M78 family)
MQVIDSFGVTKEELETVKNEAARIAALGYKVPNIEIKFIGHAQGVAGNGTIYIHPNTDLEALRFCVAHEIGHHNDPSINEPLNIWDDAEVYNFGKTSVQKMEDYANWFAANV